MKRHVLTYLEKQGQGCVEDLSYEVLSDLWENLAFKRTKGGRFYTVSTRNKILCCIQMFCTWLVNHDYLARDPSKRLETLRSPQRLPKDVLSEKEVFQLLDSIDTTTTRGFRNRVLLELLYGTGIRRSELQNLKVSHVDLEGGYLFVEQGKGKKDRVVPLGNGLCKLLREYLLFVRPKLCTREDNVHLLTSYQKKGALYGATVIKIVKDCAKNSFLKKNVYPHLLRHCCATHMIRRGAPLRHIQELLGHSSVVSTQQYTHLTIIDLKKAHAQYHPREQMKIRENPETPAHPSQPKD